MLLDEEWEQKVIWRQTEQTVKDLVHLSLVFVLWNRGDSEILKLKEDVILFQVEKISRQFEVWTEDLRIWRERDTI